MACVAAAIRVRASPDGSSGVSDKYEAIGAEAEFEPGSHRRVLRNLLGITRVRDMNEAESQALELVQEAALDLYGSDRAPCIVFGSARSTRGRASTAVSTSPRRDSNSRTHHWS